jgi:hypothetical protein
MVSWSVFAREAPDVAKAGLELLGAVRGEALLGTVRGSDPPRIHPVTIDVVEGRLHTFVLSSGKRRDLLEDGRYALHALMDPVRPREFEIRGRASLVKDEGTRLAVARNWKFQPDDTYDLFELAVETAVLGVRDSADEWPPRYQTWRAT